MVVDLYSDHYRKLKDKSRHAIGNNEIGMTAMQRQGVDGYQIHPKNYVSSQELPKCRMREINLESAVRFQLSECRSNNRQSKTAERIFHQRKTSSPVQCLYWNDVSPAG